MDDDNNFRDNNFRDERRGLTNERFVTRVRKRNTRLPGPERIARKQ